MVMIALVVQGLKEEKPFITLRCRGGAQLFGYMLQEQVGTDSKLQVWFVVLTFLSFVSSSSSFFFDDFALFFCSFGGKDPSV